MDIKQYEKISGELLKTLGYVDETLNNGTDNSIYEIRRAEYLFDRIQQDISLMKLTINKRKRKSKRGRIAR
ncbi:hypothetical protein [Cytobacillus sp. IB215316]|uniref:hypothetical protein n=1 Tax=Cytobacillus sp. IB215316 TaxID=3097354 RepID=UPI002A0FB79D|nr:hypothetical protein [Cytobacillus sp. IB215316]MDX8362146.1 hypothetical protein [Cytobacillus sp. IB215316]